jgi:hypothetical protein
MSLFRKNWTAIEAEEWTPHDLWAAVLSAVAYLLIAVGVAGVLLFQFWGFAALAGGIVCTVVMLRIIDPKLRAISTEFETKEAHYLERLNRVTRWETNDER